MGTKPDTFTFHPGDALDTIEASFGDSAMASPTEEECEEAKQQVRLLRAYLNGLLRALR